MRTRPSAGEVQSLKPPPRTVEQIVETVDRYRLAKNDAMQEAEEVLAKPPPATVDRDDLAKYYTERAEAARIAGDWVQERKNHLKALSFEDSLAKRILLLWKLSGSGGQRLEEAAQYAEKAYEIALEIRNREPWWAHELANYMVHMRLWTGNILDALEFEQAAERHFDRIQGMLSSDAMWRAYELSQRDFARAAILSARGRLQEGETYYRKAIERWKPFRTEQWPNPDVRDDAALVDYHWFVTELLENLVRQGRLEEAEALGTSVLLETIKITGPHTSTAIDNLQTLSLAIFGQGRYREARRLARESIRLLESQNADPESLYMTRGKQMIADTLVAEERWSDAMEIYNRVKDNLATNSPTYRANFQYNMNWALALLRTGNHIDALIMLAPAHDQALATLGEKHYETAEIAGFKAIALSDAGKKAEALRMFRDAIPVLLERSRRSTGAHIGKRARTQRLVAILEGYMSLLSAVRGTALEAELDLDPAVEAFRLADVARGRAVQQALSAAAARTAVGNPRLADLVRAEQDSLRRIGALYGSLANMLSLSTAEQDSEAIEELQEQIARLRDRHAEQFEKIVAEFPDYAQLVDPDPPDIDRVRRSLKPGEALVSIYSGAHRTFVWAVPARGEMAFQVVELGEPQVEALVEALRGTLEPRVGSADPLPKFDLASAHELYQRLLEPVASGWRDADSLLVTSNGALSQVPFAVLPTEPATKASDREGYFSGYRAVPWLIREYAVTVLPSATALDTLRAGADTTRQRRAFVGFGDPIFSPAQMRTASRDAGNTAARGLRMRPRLLRTRRYRSAGVDRLPRLPDTAEEVTSIARTLDADPVRDVHLELEANEEAVMQTDLFRYRNVAFATHGLVPGDLDGLQEPALALSAPELAEVDGDGLLTLSEVLQLRLDADWVVLSACNTAAADGAGAEAISGLGRAFFYAGSRALLVTYWPVETTSAKAITTGLFERQVENPRLSRAQALQRTLVDMIDHGARYDSSGKVLFTYAHPFLWAPFSIVGDGAG